MIYKSLSPNPNYATFRQRIAVLGWVLPLVLALIVVAYQLGPVRWIHDRYQEPTHYRVEILFYAVVGPLLAFWSLRLIGRWLDEKDQAEKQARRSERRLAAITTASTDAILGIDADGHIESWNRGAELLFGRTAGEKLGQPLSFLLGSGEAAAIESRWLTDTVCQAGFVRGYETTCRGTDGRQIVVELTATRLEDDQGNFLGMSAILRDITERKQREGEIRSLNASLNEQVAARTRELAEKVEELARVNAELQKLDQMRSEFISLVSHQIRAPLTNMNGAIERIRTDCQTSHPTCTRMFAILDQQLAHLDRLVRGVLSAARLETDDLALHAEPISILPVIRQVVTHTQARAAGRTIQVPTKAGLPLVYADRDLISEVLANLLDNADKYSPSDQEITLDVRADQSEITVTVRDRGPGLAPGDLVRVFDKFYRADTGDSQATYGYGLGLYVCRRLVEAQDGCIWAENHPDGGAVFSFVLPVWQGDNDPMRDPDD